MSNTAVTIIGRVASDPNLTTTTSGRSLAKFRLAHNRRVRDAQGNWSDGETSWYDVVCWQQLAANVANSVTKGQQVIVHGVLEVKNWSNGEKSGTNVELTARAVGHDLARGTSHFTRVDRIHENSAEFAGAGQAASPASQPALAGAAQSAWGVPATANQALAEAEPPF